VRLPEAIETIESEGLKTVAEQVLHQLGRSVVGEKLIESYAFGLGGRIEDERLHTDVAGIEFENPVHFGAGWDKKGRAVRGLYQLGFGGGDVGTVLPFSQYGSQKPRLWTIDSDHSVGLNRLGFNSPGDEVVDSYLEAASPLPCPIGINVGRNKRMPNEMAAWAHAEVIKRLGKYAAYVVLGISSPNTQDLRGLQDKGPFRELIQTAQYAMDENGKRVPLFAKIDSERSQGELDDMIEIMLEEGGAGFVATNSYMGSDLKAKYGARWGQEAGGLSGADPDYRELATRTVRYLYEQAGDRLTIIGAGGVNSGVAALDKIMNGASAVQVVTAIRPSRGKVAAQINRELCQAMDRSGVRCIKDLVGASTDRGAKAA
jgi:dihydroorotate dehydrogenase